MSLRASGSSTLLARWVEAPPESAPAEVCAQLAAAFGARRAALLRPSDPEGPPLVAAVFGLERGDLRAWLRGAPAPRRVQLRIFGRVTGQLAIDADVSAPAEEAGALCALAAMLLADGDRSQRDDRLLEPLRDLAAAVPPLLVRPGSLEWTRDLPAGSVLIAAEAPPRSEAAGTARREQPPAPSDAAVVPSAPVEPSATEGAHLNRVAARDPQATVLGRLTALEAVLASLSEGVLICDANGDTLLVNPSLCRLLGVESVPRDRVLRGQLMDIRDLQGRPLPLEATPVGTALSGRSAAGVRLLVRRADGQDRVLEESAAPVHDAGGHIAGCALVLRDVTRLQRLTEERDDFISVAAHELRTPLTALLLEVQLLTRTAERGGAPEAWLPHLRRLGGSAQRMKKLVDGLLDVSRLERGTARIHPEPLDLGQLVEEEAGRLRELYPALPLRVRRDPVPAVRADRLRLAQVLANLVDNAVKYCATGTPVDIDVRLEGGMAALHVRDHGQGLPDSDCAQLFTRYFRAQEHQQGGPRRDTGLGLGLFIAKQIADLHGGTITAGNHPAGGLSVVLRLPLAGPADAGPPTAPGAERRAVSPAGEPHARR